MLAILSFITFAWAAFADSSPTFLNHRSSVGRVDGDMFPDNNMKEEALHGKKETRWNVAESDSSVVVEPQSLSPAIAAPDQHPMSPSENNAKVWRAPHDDAHVRRLSGRRLDTITVTLGVIRNDAFFPGGSRLGVYYETDANSSLVSVYFSGTSGNTQGLMPADLRHGMRVQLTGAPETDPAQFTALRSQMAVSTGGDTPLQTVVSAEVVNSQPIFVATEMHELVTGNGSIADASSGGTAPQTLTALVVLVHPCGQTFSASAQTIESAIFGSHQDSFASTFRECSRNVATVTGKAIGPIVVCPSGEAGDLGETWRSVSSVLQRSYSSDYNQYTYKILIQPDSWQKPVGAGMVGGTVSWVRASYYQHALMHLHEVGHNLFLHHSGSISDRGLIEYGDTSSSMGYCCTRRCYHFIHAWQLGWANVAQEVPIASIPTTESLTLNLKELAHHTDSGVVVNLDGSNNQYNAKSMVISHRGSTGFDSFLQNQYKNQIYVHLYNGMSMPTLTKQTWLIASARSGETIVIQGLGLKLTWTSSNQDVATVLLCKGTENSPCTTGPSNPGPAPTPAPTPPGPSPTPPPKSLVWTSYFSEEQEAGEITSQAMAGLGCRGQFCDEVRTAHSQDIRVDLSSAGSWISNSGQGVAMLGCGANEAVSRLRCSGENCATVQIQCARVLGGQLKARATSNPTRWIPAEMHKEEEGTCSPSSVVTGLKCTGDNCGMKMLTCQEFEAERCKLQATCSALGMECSSDGCGDSCGTCPTDQATCLGSAGRCVSTTIKSDWISSDKDMSSTGLTAIGMGCQSDYCGEIQLRLMGVKVDLASKENSGWISDNVGARYFWNKESDATMADCPAGKVVTRVECRAKHCDDVRLECATPTSWKVDPLGSPWIGPDWFSEEEEAMQECPVGFGMVGMECKPSEAWWHGCFKDCGHYCDKKKIRCRQLTPIGIGFANLGIANATDIEAAQKPAFECDEECRAGSSIRVSMSGAQTRHGSFAFPVTLVMWILVQPLGRPTSTQ